MAFDAGAFRARLEGMAGLLDAHYGRETRPEFWAWHFPEGDQSYQVGASGLFAPDMSAHGRLPRDLFVTDFREELARFDALLRATIPALDHPSLTFRLDIPPPTPRGDRFQIDIRGGRLVHARQIPKVLERLEWLHGHLGDLPAPEAVYLVGGTPVPAASPAAALKTHVCLHRPGLIAVPAAAAEENLVVSRVCDIAFQDVFAT